jgi:FKBP-type peptidyl-prolyl cis-trans isomerase SlyD
MKIETGSAVAIDYRLHLGDGEIVDESTPEEPLSYIQGQGQLVPGLEQALEGMSPGDKKSVVVPPADGYGEIDPERVQTVPRAAFPREIEPEPGMHLMAHGPGGEEIPLAVREVKADGVVVDMNHPLAGKTLHFDVTVRNVRAATEDEMAHGHVHGPEGHAHGPESDE